jgi:hypothetical protein
MRYFRLSSTCCNHYLKDILYDTWYDIWYIYPRSPTHSVSPSLESLPYVRQLQDAHQSLNWIFKILTTCISSSTFWNVVPGAIEEFLITFHNKRSIILYVIEVLAWLMESNRGKVRTKYSLYHVTWFALQGTKLLHWTRRRTRNWGE